MTRRSQKAKGFSGTYSVIEPFTSKCYVESYKTYVANDVIYIKIMGNDDQMVLDDCPAAAKSPIKESADQQQQAQRLKKSRCAAASSTNAVVHFHGYGALDRTAVARPVSRRVADRVGPDNR
jgi:hypothetical protein